MLGTRQCVHIQPVSAVFMLLWAGLSARRGRELEGDLSRPKQLLVAGERLSYTQRQLLGTRCIGGDLRLFLARGFKCKSAHAFWGVGRTFCALQSKSAQMGKYRESQDTVHENLVSRYCTKEH